MQLIPVIDLKSGIAVHAKRGLRQHYAPLKTALCASNKITDVIQAFLKLHPFSIIYIADLDAIMGTGNHHALIQYVLQQYPHIIFWVDQGYQATPSLLSTFKNYQAVLGSESYDESNVEALKTVQDNFILSLDFSSEDQPLGANVLFNHPSYWTKKTIIMTLARVGSHLGVDVDKLQYYQTLNPIIHWVASGGVRSVEDILALKKIGIKYALCASALHNQKISRSDFAKF
ncbi:MAG: nickel transporter [Methylococcales bacterium]|nr:nickel transporter [Methylococcales bacterium]